MHEEEQEGHFPMMISFRLLSPQWMLCECLDKGIKALLHPSWHDFYLN
jgi:hypothetical protein